MTLEQLRIFVAVAERQHMTRAAQALNITQSAASAAIAALEARHDTRLFDRVGRGLALSEAGRAFLPEARAVLARAADAGRLLDDLAGLKRGRIDIFASQTVGSYWLPPRLAAFGRVHPGIELNLAIGNTAQVTEAVLSGAVELGFVEGAVEAPLLERRQVGADRLAMVATPDHPLARDAAFEISALADHRWVRREAGSGTRSEFEQALRDLGGDPDALPCALALASNEAILAAVAQGGLLAAVSELAARPLIASGALVTIGPELPPRPFDLVRHPERRPSRAAAALLERLD
ncbi:MAG: LysR family transcriptional regulator [Phenylobacterium sp.]|uniref:LysR substrate-binding domain-containing protein n=1 Tax=Phenylobacterium sp. TaxID=1871053 RepID=UPI0025CD665D|nr:LysR substrate-binding domain-containing protein [Phenylobacterium sp.]MBA4013548.1 LysR family transcriptional regulator [Phenylobacterium sp.]